MSEFADYDMPITYPGGATAEHELVRRSVGLFDISHMGRIEIYGKQAGDALARLLSADVRKLEIYESCYALMCHRDGGILDDVFVYRLADRFLVVLNAANRESDLAWMREQSSGLNAGFHDVSETTAMIAVQGPRSLELIEHIRKMPVTFPRFYACETSLFGTVVLMSRTGYTGEEGVEIVLPAEQAAGMWAGLLRAAEEAGIEAGPAGLAARDSLRFEPGFALYGHELSLETSPVEARLLWACDFSHEFIGRHAIEERKAAGGSRRLTTFIMEDAGVPRPGCAIEDSEGATIGEVVSGMKAPSADCFAGNAYIEQHLAGIGNEIFIVIRNQKRKAVIVKRPLYRPNYRIEDAKGAADASAHAAGITEYGSFLPRHIGPDTAEQKEMLEQIGCSSLDELIDQAVPDQIRRKKTLRLPAAAPEDLLLQELRQIASRNTTAHSLIGQGYYGTVMPAVIRRTILENPAWYTQYTPYQAEISQGRLEALLNFQTMISDLSGMEISNASMLDEGTAAAEAMLMCRRSMPRTSTADRFFIHSDCHPQTIELVLGRAEAQSLHVEIGDWDHLQTVLDSQPEGTFFGALFQYPGSSGTVHIPADEIRLLHEKGVPVVAAADLLALTLLPEPGGFGVDITVGSTQRFGLPMGFGGPHAGYLACKGELMRQMPGRLVGVSKDRMGKDGIRLALQTREQHIRRSRATSNICTAQVLPAILASMYAVYHGPEGLKSIAERIRRYTWLIETVLRDRGYCISSTPRFDTIEIRDLSSDECVSLMLRAEHLGFLLRRSGREQLSLSVDESLHLSQLPVLLQAFPRHSHPAGAHSQPAHRPESISLAELEALLMQCPELPQEIQRKSPFLQHPNFNRYRSETQIMRYIRSLEQKDLSLAHSMIPLGSCTMKLNPAAAMEAISYEGFASLHPFAPYHHSRGYQDLITALGSYLAEITGLPAVSMQPNSGAQGEYTGLLMIRAYHISRGEAQRTVCLVPDSAHGTNPASAVMAGFEVVTIPSAADGSIDTEELSSHIRKQPERIGAIMITYPSTHGVFDANILEAVAIVHEAGGQVYLDGANLNAMMGISSPALVGADVCHLNLHKTFAIPHGGGGPGMGPVCAAAHLMPFLPPASFHDPHDYYPGPSSGSLANAVCPPVSSAPFGSPSILPISYAYIRLMGPNGLLDSSRTAILNANYIAARLEQHYPISYRNSQGRLAHECILDLREMEKSSGIRVEDVAKRLMDYGFHAPTMAWPEPGTLMIEPTESESKEELDRFCEALIAIRGEIRELEDGSADPEDNLLKNAPHTLEEISADSWTHLYSREKAAYPLEWVREHKFWPASARIDNVQGDRHPVCSCPM
ncbi:hypothetical protein JCM12856_06590 [Spirochaeta dissipatitropha]